MDEAAEAIERATTALDRMTMLERSLQRAVERAEAVGRPASAFLAIQGNALIAMQEILYSAGLSDVPPYAWVLQTWKSLKRPDSPTERRRRAEDLVRTAATAIAYRDNLAPPDDFWREGDSRMAKARIFAAAWCPQSMGTSPAGQEAIEKSIARMRKKSSDLLFDWRSLRFSISPVHQYLEMLPRQRGRPSNLR